MHRFRTLVVAAFLVFAVGLTGNPSAQEPGRGSVTVLPGTRLSAFATIQGHAMDSQDRPMPNAVVRLRDARLGRIVATETTDKDGAYVFRNVDPGSYVVELMKKDQTVIATTPIININGGESMTTIVRMPFRPPLGGLLGHSTAQAIVITTAAAAAGVLATDVIGQDATAVR